MRVSELLVRQPSARRRVLGVGSVVLALAALVASPASAARPMKIDTIATGLDAPRHLAFDNRGNLFVAEAGRGGDGPCFFAAEGPACMGATGAVTEIPRHAHQFRVVSGLASFANRQDVQDPMPPNPIGPHGITVVRDQVFVTNGGPTEPLDAPLPDGKRIDRATLAAQNPVANLFGRLLLVGHRGHVRSIADIWAFERDVNPDQTVGNPEIDSNAVDVLFDRGRFLIADAGGNAIDRVSFGGRVSNLAVFPNRLVANPMGGADIPMQAVPTSVVEGPDHQYYVSQLTGVPFPVGGANVYRVDPRTGNATVFASGFTNIMDLAFGRDGTLYVLEISHSGLLSGSADGAIFAIGRDGSRRQIELPPGKLTAPGGITVGRDGLYVSNQTFVPGQGEVLRIRAR